MATTLKTLPVGWGPCGYAFGYSAGHARARQLGMLAAPVRTLLAAAWVRSALPALEAAHPRARSPRACVAACERWALEEQPWGGLFRPDSPAAQEMRRSSIRAWNFATSPVTDKTRHIARAVILLDGGPAYVGYTSRVAWSVAEFATPAARPGVWAWLYHTFRCARRRGRAFDPAWRTRAAVGLARGIAAERAFDRMPVLADAVEEAGCADRTLLDHLRVDRGLWTAADWALWQLLGLGGPSRPTRVKQ